MRPVLQKRLGTQQLEIDQAVERPRRLGGLGLSDFLEPCLQLREMIVLWPESVTVCSRQHREEDLHTREGTVLMNPGGLIGALGIETGEDIARLQPGVSPGAHGWHACWVQALVQDGTHGLREGLCGVARVDSQGTAPRHQHGGE